MTDPGSHPPERIAELRARVLLVERLYGLGAHLPDCITIFAPIPVLPIPRLPARCSTRILLADRDPCPKCKQARWIKVPSRPSRACAVCLRENSRQSSIRRATRSAASDARSM